MLRLLLEAEEAVVLVLVKFSLMVASTVAVD
jgi:hypothetical protein